MLSATAIRSRTSLRVYLSIWASIAVLCVYSVIPGVCQGKEGQFVDSFRNHAKILQEVTMKEYDVVIIGSGAGANLIEDALEHNKSLAIVDKGPLGGTCLNTH